MQDITSLARLGWQQFFQQQLSLDDLENFHAARVTAQRDHHVSLTTELGPIQIPLTNATPALAIGDWVLLDSQQQIQRVLDRISTFRNESADSSLIAANIDTVFIVCSLVDDFNLNRIKHYLTLTKKSGAEAVVVLTKADRCEKTELHVRDTLKLAPMLMVEAVNGLSKSSVSALQPWCESGKTIVLLGSPGAGVSTLRNTLFQDIEQQSLPSQSNIEANPLNSSSHLLRQTNLGCLLLETPDLLALQLEAGQSNNNVSFSEINDLVNCCRFSDCKHNNEPGCAVQQAIKSGALDLKRLNQYRDAMREQAKNSATKAEKRASDKDWEKNYRIGQAEARSRKNN